MGFQSEEVTLVYIDHSWIQRQFRLLQCFLSIFPIFFSQRVSHIIQLPFEHLDSTLINHLSLHLSTYPIRHSLWLSVSCGSQGNTIQRSSPHKCDQKSSCNAFNAVAIAFPQIFLGFLPSGMFMRHVPIIVASQRVILIAGIHI